MQESAERASASTAMSLSRGVSFAVDQKLGQDVERASKPSRFLLDRREACRQSTRHGQDQSCQSDPHGDDRIDLGAQRHSPVPQPCPSIRCILMQLGHDISFDSRPLRPRAFSLSTSRAPALSIPASFMTRFDSGSTASCPDLFRASTWVGQLACPRSQRRCRKTWMPGTSPGMTKRESDGAWSSRLTRISHPRVDARPASWPIFKAVISGPEPGSRPRTGIRLQALSRSTSRTPALSIPASSMTRFDSGSTAPCPDLFRAWRRKGTARPEKPRTVRRCLPIDARWPTSVYSAPRRLFS